VKNTFRFAFLSVVLPVASYSLSIVVVTLVVVVVVVVTVVVATPPLSSVAAL